MTSMPSNSLFWASLVGCGLAVATPATAQEGASLQSAIWWGTGLPCDDVADAIEAHLLKSGLKTGWNEKTKTFCVYSLMDLLPSEEPGEKDLVPQKKSGNFASRREATFEAVATDAAEQLAIFIGAEVARMVRAHYVEGSKLDLAIPGVARATDLLRQAADAASSAKELVVSEAFSKAVSVIAMQEVAALQCFQSYESIKLGGRAGTVGAIFVLNRTSQAMQAAMLGKDAAKKRAPGSTSMEHAMRAFKDGRLAATHGVLLHVDETGEVCLLAVAHSVARSRRRIGSSDTARDAAMGYLRSFAGERVFLSAKNTESYTLQEYADLSLTFSSQERRESYIKRISADLNMQGASQVYHRVHTHKASGERMQTVVMEWKLTAANTANLFNARSKMMQGAAGGKGTDGLFPPRRR